MYRKTDLYKLSDTFDRNSNDIALLYGTPDNGLSEIISDFIKDKECFYYLAMSVDDRTQKRLFAAQLHEQTKSPLFPDDDYGKLIGSFINDHPEKGKKLIVFDNLENLLRENTTFINYIANMISEDCNPSSVMFLLVSDDPVWVECDMLRLIGAKSSEISCVVGLKEYTPSEFYSAFPKMPLSDMIAIYSVLGGKSSYYDGITEETTFRSFISGLIQKWSAPGHDHDEFLPRNTREAALYNTILVNIASSSGKLNDLHVATGIDRAKLAVYLKKLTDNGIVEKVGSAVYRIKDGLIRFYYRFVFPNISSVVIMNADRFYRRFIEHGIYDFIEDVYPQFCMEHIRWLEKEDRLNFRVTAIERFHDKYKAIDFVIVAAGGNMIACACRYNAPHMAYKTYEDVRTSVRRNKLLCDNIWLFSASGFDQKLSMFQKVTLGVKLIEGKDQRLR